MSERRACEAHDDGHRFRFAGRAPVVDEASCERPTLMACACGESYSSRCGSSSRTRCGGCARTYQLRVRRVASSGFVLPGRRYLLTLTAPGDTPHKYRGQWCPCTDEGGTDLACWNGEAANRWNKFITDVRRTIGPCEYFCAKEAQKRGALHMHAPIRFLVPSKVRLSKLRALAIRHGFGHEVDLQEVTDDGELERACRYVSKYVTKAATEREAVPFVHRVTGEVGPGRWRTWTASRAWGSSMATVRSAQRAWWSAVQSSEGAGGGPQGGEAPEGGPGVAEGGALDSSSVSYAGTHRSPCGSLAPA